MASYPNVVPLGGNAQRPGPGSSYLPPGNNS